MTLDILKHTPGGQQHDQSEHGNWSQGQTPDPNAPQAPVAPEKYSSGTGTEADPIVTNDIGIAIDGMLNEQHVQLESVDEVATLLVDMRTMIRDGRVSGDEVGNFNLCLVSVAGTNLFCGEHVGKARLEMPQFGGDALEGSIAALNYPSDAYPGKVDVGPAFVEYLENQGVGITNESVLASHLKASQTELIGPKVFGIAAAYEAGTLPNAPIFVSRDGFIIDGHHRWAGIIASDLLTDGDLGDFSMDVIRIDMSITEILPIADQWTTDIGMIKKVGKILRKMLAKLLLHPRFLKHTPGGQPHDQDEHGNWAQGQDDSSGVEQPGAFDDLSTEQLATEELSGEQLQEGLGFGESDAELEFMQEEIITRQAALEENPFTAMETRDWAYDQIQVLGPVRNFARAGEVVHNLNSLYYDAVNEIEIPTDILNVALNEKYADTIDWFNQTGGPMTAPINLLDLETGRPSDEFYTWYSDALEEPEFASVTMGWGTHPPIQAESVESKVFKENLSEMFDEMSQHGRKRQQDLSVAIATGDLSFEDAPELGWKGLGGIRTVEDYGASAANTGELPDELFHVTTDAAGVQATGIQSRTELDMRSGAGLGGGPANTISFTADRATADGILTAMNERHLVLNNPSVEIPRLIEEAKAEGWWGDPGESSTMAVKWEGDLVDRLSGGGLQNLYDGVYIHTTGAAQTPGDMFERLVTGDSGFAQGFDAETFFEPLESSAVAGATEPHYFQFRVARTASGRMEAIGNFMDEYTMRREMNGGPLDPLFVSNDDAGFAAMSTSNFAVTRATPVSGAQGYQVSSLGEWRTWSGDAIAELEIIQ